MPQTFLPYFIAFFTIAQKIHISSSTKEILDLFEIFDMELRGEVEMKVQFIIFHGIV